jgi:hypothetical protein
LRTEFYNEETLLVSYYYKNCRPHKMLGSKNYRNIQTYNLAYKSLLMKLILWPSETLKQQITTRVGGLMENKVIPHIANPMLNKKA